MAKVQPSEGERASLTMKDAELAISSEKKNRVTTILKISAFIDLAGVVLLAPAYNQMALNAPNAPATDVIPSDSFPNLGMPDYSLAVMLFGMCSSMGGAIGNPITGKMSDTKGRKFVIILCLMGGTVSYVLMFIAGAVLKNYWVFLCGNFLNGLFGGSRSAVQAYLQDVWGREFGKIQPGLYSVFMYGAAGGGILGMLILLIVLPLDLAGGLFIPAAVAAVLSSACAFTVWRQCPEPPRKAPPPKDEMVFTPVHTKVYADGKGKVSSTAAGPWTNLSSCSDKLPEGEFDITNQIKGKLKERINVKVGAESKNICNPVKPAEGGELQVPKKVNTILWTIILAGAMDNFGDSGTTFARSALMTKKWPWSTAIVIQGCVVILTVILVKASMEILVRNSMKKQRLELKWWLVVGNLSTSLFQYIMIPIMLIECAGACPYAPPGGVGSFVGFLVTWSFSKLWGFTSTLGALFMLPAYAPADQRGSWLGRNSGVQQATAVLTPLVLWLVERSAGGTVVLAVCGSVSLIATVSYFGGVVLNVPKPLPHLKVAVTEADLERYESMARRDFGLLDWEVRMAVNQMLQGQKKEILFVPWGSYREDLPNLQVMRDRAPKEFRNLRMLMLDTLTSKAKLTAQHGKIKDYYADIDRRFDKKKEQQDFGMWVADYFDDAGYSSWIMYPDMYKAMVMNAFPPLENLDDRTDARAEEFSVVDFEDKMLKWLEIMDMHIAQTNHLRRSTQIAYHPNGGLDSV